MEDNQHAAQRRERRRASALVNQVGDALKQSQQLTLAGKLADADRAARLGERHAKLAERLINLKAALHQIWKARMDAQRALEASFSEHDAALKEREQKLSFAELALEDRKRYAPPLDPHADRWKERLGRNESEP